jgi:hypothetical protein
VLIQKQVSANIVSLPFEQSDSFSHPETPTTSIFMNPDYLTLLLAYCDHCLKILFQGKDELLMCEQCPAAAGGYGVCDECITLMPLHHPSMHTFSKTTSNSEALKKAHDLPHLNITCNSCSKKDFEGIRYHCKTCEPSFDLCEDCFNKTHEHHTFKIIPHPYLLAGNKGLLAQRSIAVIGASSDTRDSLTGWTKKDAETILEETKLFRQTYQTEFQAIKQLKRQQAQMELQFRMQNLRDIQSLVVPLSGSVVYHAWR